MYDITGFYNPPIITPLSSSWIQKTTIATLKSHFGSPDEVGKKLTSERSGESGAERTRGRSRLLCIRTDRFIKAAEDRPSLTPATREEHYICGIRAKPFSFACNGRSPVHVRKTTADEILDARYIANCDSHLSRRLPGPHGIRTAWSADRIGVFYWLTREIAGTRKKLLQCQVSRKSQSC